jgi:hypothetical protein
MRNLTELFSRKSAAPALASANDQLSGYDMAIVHQARMRERTRHSKVFNHCEQIGGHWETATKLLCESDMTADAIIEVLNTAGQPKSGNPNEHFLRQFIPTK